ncbi:uncharacterized protein CTHT_0029440 [Thermochaetoides thermophila DSM 1495]|uniref:Uncharacterized protein n=1 Tax=Chaetomium thermophilum (strain DSM 1495 / CBS 144.50 / IMI 039719) TaxID=759272 RepID=G0S856_CHATD|nr:hypothetical protein CTHT_0029440 [Thermochaetoides thermophila DSM 1495]EGS21103.1 hypothetical protein CTHT_0029440 [Thermochaetoides thermophila DSM 1495]
MALTRVCGSWLSINMPASKYSNLFSILHIAHARSNTGTLLISVHSPILLASAFLGLPRILLDLANRPVRKASNTPNFLRTIRLSASKPGSLSNFPKITKILPITTSMLASKPICRPNSFFIKTLVHNLVNLPNSISNLLLTFMLASKPINLKEFFESIERIPEWFDILETKGTICLELRSPDRLERYMELLLILSNLPDLAYEQRLLRSQTVRPWTKEWHDPDEGWPTALQRKNGGWWRCRDGPDATLPELMCGVCRGLRRSPYYEDWVQIHDDLERDRTEQLTLYLSEIRKAQAEAHKKEALKFKWRMQYEDQMRKEQQRQAVLSRYVRNQMLGDPGVNWLNHTPRAGRGVLGKESLKTRAQLLREMRAAWYAMARGDPSSMIFRKICSIASQSSAHARARSLQERLYPETKSPILAAGKQQALQQFQICFLSQTNSFLKKRSSGEQNTKRQSQAQTSETGLFQIQHHEDVQAESSAMAETRARMKAKWSFQVHKDDDEPVQDNPAIIPYNFPEADEAPNASPEKDKDKASIRAQFDSQKQSKTRVELPKKAKTDNRVRFAEPEVSNTHVFTSLPLVEPEEEQTPTHSSDHRSLELERIPPRPILKPGGFKGKGKAKSVTWALP